MDELGRKKKLDQNFMEVDPEFVEMSWNWYQLSPPQILDHPRL
jgi:hypothetical protein